MLYKALWYFPVLMAAGGCATVVWDYRRVHNLLKAIRRKSRRSMEQDNADVEATELEVLGQTSRANPSTATRPTSASTARLRTDVDQSISRDAGQNKMPDGEAAQRDVSGQTTEAFSRRIFFWKLGVLVLACFSVIFVAIMVLRGVLHSNSRGFNLFANLFLAGMFYAIL